MPEGSANSPNSNHERRLSVTCRYIDKLLADMESILSVSSSRLAFPRYIPDLTSAPVRSAGGTVRGHWSGFGCFRSQTFP
jgi:hypothetical protein